MDTNITYIAIVGFFGCFILLFYFIARYREFFETTSDNFNFQMKHSEPTQPDNRAELAEIKDIKDKFKTLTHMLEENRREQEKSNKQFLKNIADIEKRVSSFEEEYINKLQPAIASLVSELETLTTAQEDIQKSMKEVKGSNSKTAEQINKH
ncbi:MAG: hypothetical protein HN833_04680 [Elusimicrobiaceae bacterium]|jgi:chromosome segregation ATPase|nr:hypothetical protein [Elusimicrobiaceae bacterium]MBT3955438.1 hypothetical protein [Elusimicrobiaceae bacterium]MBT4008195.1 hypothetical protein [Elusimicrobiaceae bacterium]MBT4402505.1 hypothetical protein [Elusimicrobiaceae bacterium]MBT4439632.1 hypothetical protein [Elusimicrobiaceae bacterium]